MAKSTTTDIHRAPPHSVEAETCVVSSVFQDPRKYIPIVQQRLSEDHFYVPALRAMFNAMINFYDEYGQFTLPEFTVEMVNTGQAKNMGGPGFITEVFNFVPTGDAIDYYLDTVCDKYALRQIIAVDSESVRKAYEQGADAKEVLADREARIEVARMRLGVGRTRLPVLTDMSNHLDEKLPEEPPEIVRGILHKGSKKVLGGTSKGRKTMGLIDLGVSVATGSSWWGFPCVKGPVCYINFEIQDAFFAKRVNAVCKAKDVKLEAGMLVAWNLRGHGDGIENLIEDLLAVLRHRQFVLLIVDPIYKALGTRDENKAGEVASMMNQLEKIAVRTGAAIAFGAHYSKGNQALKESIDRIGGSGVFARDPDSILTMTAHEEPECFTVDATLRNFAPIEPFVVRWEWPLFRRADELDPRALKQPRGPKEKHSPNLLLDQLSAVQGIKPKEAIKYLDEQHGVSRKTVYRMKDVLEGKKLMFVKEGQWWRRAGG